MSSSKRTTTKVCFVIAPIGDEGSETRIRSDQILKHIITPAAAECGYETIRADQISEPGIITSQVIQHIVDDPLVIADLTSRNPNVFYELSLRHALRKAVVQIIHEADSIPFDVAPTRTILFNHQNLDSVANAKENIVKQIKSVEKNPTEVDSPISVAMELQLLRKSDNPLEKSTAEIIDILHGLKGDMRELKQDYRLTTRSSPLTIEELARRDWVMRNEYVHYPKEQTKRIELTTIDAVKKLLSILDGPTTQKSRPVAKKVKPSKKTKN